MNPPTAKEKNNLPENVRALYNKAVELYQCIQLYELGVLGRDEFIFTITEIEKKYQQ